ncbi:MAG: peptide deformylase [Planctomycetaceae bacterium]|nr:peptide deformylase [Planctomycetaceae bacterium]
MQIITYPHPILRYQCKPVQKIDQGLRNIIDQMFEEMYNGDGVGLAANQVCLPYRLFVLNTSGDRTKTENEYVFINPIIMKKRGSAESEEGCLSFPEIHAPVVRPAEVVIQGVSADGQIQEFHWNGFAAKAVQHETDHLNGITFIDRLSSTLLLDIRESLYELELEFDTNRRLKLIPSDEEIATYIEEMERKYC